MSFNQDRPTVPTVLNTSNCFIFSNSSSGNALSVQQLGAGNVATFRTTTGATALFINPSGYVGIGTTNPTSQLHVYSLSGSQTQTGQGVAQIVSCGGLPLNINYMGNGGGLNYAIYSVSGTSTGAQTSKLFRYLGSVLSDGNSGNLGGLHIEGIIGGGGVGGNACYLKADFTNRGITGGYKYSQLTGGTVDSTMNVFMVSNTSSTNYDLYIQYGNSGYNGFNLDIKSTWNTFNFINIEGTADPRTSPTNHTTSWDLLGTANFVQKGSNGSVGIGTTNPSSGGGANSLGGALLDVYATGTGVSSNVNISAGCDGSPSTANKASIIFNTKGAGGGIVNGGITHQYFTAGSGTYGFNFQPFGLVSSVMSILGSGNVGIGTTNPGNILDLYGSNPTLSIGTSTAVYGGGSSTLLFNTTYTGGGNAKIVATDVAPNGTAYQGRLDFYAQYNVGQRLGMSILGASTTRCNVGIGTANPGYPLVVNYTNSSGGLNETGIYINNTVKTNASQLSLAAGNVYSIISNGSLSGNAFQIYNYSRSLAPFNISSAGNVGIGIATPAAPLDLSTTFSTAGITNSSTLWLNALTNLSGASSGANYTGSIFRAGDNNRQALLLYAGGAYPNGAGIIQSKDILVGRNYGQRLLLNPDGGNVGIGTTSPRTILDVNGDSGITVSSTNGAQTITLLYTGFTTNGGAYQGFTTGVGTVQFRSGASGGVTLLSGATAWTATSDARLKNIIEPISNAISKIEQINPVIYTLKDDTTNARRVGVIAQDILKIQPEAVGTGDDGMYGVRYTELIPLALAAIKELSAENTALKSRLDSLEARLAAAGL